MKNFGETIREGAAANASTIGVDIAAEQRQANCVKCKNALMDIQLNVPFLVERMSDEQALKLNALLPKLEEIAL